jgi:hypothetical protein
MIYYINNANDFISIKNQIKPVFVKSLKTGKMIEIPCLNTILVKVELVKANHYNPNSVPKDKMQLLEQSIMDNGFCFPVVAIWDDIEEIFIVIDGFHRTIIGGEGWMDLEYIPLVFLKHNINKRMTATIQFNKARGVHQVELDADIIRSLIEQGMSEIEICNNLKIDAETVHRYKSLTGIASIFKNAQYSNSWEINDN